MLSDEENGAAQGDLIVMPDSRIDKVTKYRKEKTHYG